MTTFTLGLVADDLTGANDTAVQFARRGWDALLVLEKGSDALFAATSRKRLPTSLSVVAVTTDSRALDNVAAEQLTADAVAQLVAAGVDRIYLKIDSTMRGSVPGQIAGALKAWRLKHPAAVAVVCPAYPTMRRTVVANQLLVAGEPVERTAIGSDPVTPVKASDLTVLIPGSKHVPVDDLAQSSASILTVDARGNEDLSYLASAIERIAVPAIPVGSAGLADAMAEVWNRVRSVRLQPDLLQNAVRSVRLQPDRFQPDLQPDRLLPPLSAACILIQVTSLNPVSRAQIEKLGTAFPEVVVLSGRAEDVSATFADRFDAGRWDLLGLIGGDGARAALHRLGASAIRVVGAQLEGIPVGLVVGGRADGMPVFTKAGGFGNEDALVRLVEGLKK